MTPQQHFLSKFWRRNQNSSRHFLSSNIALKLKCKCMVSNSRTLGSIVPDKIFQTPSNNSAATMVSTFSLLLHMHPKATVVLNDSFKNIGIALVFYYSPPTYLSTCGLQQYITPTGYAIASLLLVLTMKYPSCVGNPTSELTTNHV